MDEDAEFILHEYHVINNNILPKTLFFNRLLRPDYGGGAPHIRVRNERFRCIRVVEKGASELFGKFPVFNKYTVCSGMTSHFITGQNWITLVSSHHFRSKNLFISKNTT